MNADQCTEEQFKSTAAYVWNIICNGLIKLVPRQQQVKLCSIRSSFESKHAWEFKNWGQFFYKKGSLHHVWYGAGLRVHHVQVHPPKQPMIRSLKIHTKRNYKLFPLILLFLLEGITWNIPSIWVLSMMRATIHVMIKLLQPKRYTRSPEATQQPKDWSATCSRPGHLAPVLESLPWRSGPN